jgi:hypothetical protein
MKENTVIKKEPTAYEIRKIILNDGTELDINKITHAAIVKDRRDGDNIEFKITYCCKEKDELLALSNQCNLMAYAFKFMSEYNVSFDEAAKMYDELLKEAKKMKGIDLQ